MPAANRVNTRKGSMIPSDEDPATFWITHPDSFITGNTAGGSEGKGFWFLQAALPTGEAGELQEAGEKHFFDKNELFRTKLGDISGNNVHSSKFGFFFDSELLPDQGTTGNNGGRFAPVEDPKKPGSAKVTTHISDITCYKSEHTCIWMHLENAKFRESKMTLFLPCLTLLILFNKLLSDIGSDCLTPCSSGSGSDSSSYMSSCGL